VEELRSDLMKELEVSWLHRGIHWVVVVLLLPPHPLLLLLILLPPSLAPPTTTPPPPLSSSSQLTDRQLDQLSHALQDDDDEEEEDGAIMSCTSDSFSLRCLDQCLRSLPHHVMTYPVVEESVEVFRGALQKGQVTRWVNRRRRREGEGGGGKGKEDQ